MDAGWYAVPVCTIDYKPWIACPGKGEIVEWLGEVPLELCFKNIYLSSEGEERRVFN